MYVQDKSAGCMSSEQDISTNLEEPGLIESKLVRFLNLLELLLNPHDLWSVAKRRLMRKERDIADVHSQII